MTEKTPLRGSADAADVSGNAASNASKKAAGEEMWPRKLNKVLIGIGVIAFGLIITDRLINMFRVDDLPDWVQIERNVIATATDTSVSTEQLVVGVADGVVDNATDAADAIVVTEGAPDSGGGDAPAESDAPALSIDDVFGSRVVFVSASEPLYVVTANDRRIDVGSEIDRDTSLAGLTSQKVILERAGNLVVLSLPEPSTE